MSFPRFFLVLAMVLVLFSASGCSCGDDEEDGDDDDNNDDASDDEDMDDDDSSSDDDDNGDDDDDDDDDDDTSPVDLVYIYNGLKFPGGGYQIYFESEGYSFAMQDITELDQKDGLREADLYFIDEAADDSAWDQTRADVLTAMNKPVIANCKGVAYFDFLTTYLSTAKFQYAGDFTQFVPADPNHPIWTIAYDMGLTNQDPIEVYYQHTGIGVMVNDQVTIEVEFIGLTTAIDTWAPIAVEGKYAFWGFGYDHPGHYYEEGQETLVNLVEYLKTAD
jgi:hypothetical protein